MNFPLPVRSGSITVNAIGMAVVEKEGAGLAVGILVLSHGEAEICLGGYFIPSPICLLCE